MVDVLNASLLFDRFQMKSGPLFCESFPIGWPKWIDSVLESSFDEARKLDESFTSHRFKTRPKSKNKQTAGVSFIDLKIGPSSPHQLSTTKLI